MILVFNAFIVTGVQSFTTTMAFQRAASATAEISNEVLWLTMSDANPV